MAVSLFVMKLLSNNIEEGHMDNCINKNIYPWEISFLG